jgi:predicted GIY-YIG superfamily endonuclease
MAEVQQVEVNSASHMRNQARVKRDEEELRELMKQAGLAQEDETQEEATDSEPYSESSEDTSVQAESVSKQEEKEPAKAETQEADDTELGAEEKTFKQRYGDLRRHMQEKDKEVASKLEKLEKQLEAATKNELVLPKSNEEIEAWAKKYPDVAGIVEAIAAKKADERSSDIDKRLKEIEELRVTAKREKAEAELAAIHPDFGEIRSDDTFHEWAKDQPKWVQDALYENVEDAKSVARVIDLYKVDKGITGKPKKSSSDKGAASSVMTKRTTTPNDTEESKYLRESQVAKMSIKEYEKRMDEIMEAQRSGKFIYDVSKK